MGEVAQASRSRKGRSGARRATGSRPRGPSAASVRTRRVVFASLAGLIVVIAAVVIALPDKVDQAIQELTLPLRHEDIIRQQASDKDVDASLIAGVIYAESRFRDQTSTAGARGLMQITEPAAADIARLSGATSFEFSDLADPQINISYGTFLLREHLERYDGNEAAALAAYNAGPGNADEWGASDLEIGDIRFPETRAYVETVLEKREEYREKYPKELGY